MKAHDIEEFISHYPSLSVKENKGGRFRIMHSSIKNQHGSLWFRAYSDKYRIYPTGEVISLLETFIKNKFGSPSGQDMERDYWFINNLNDVKEVVRVFGELKI
jgi:hypothetical protein